MQPFMSRDTINVRLIRYLDNHIQPVTLVQIASELGLDRNTVKKHLAELQTLIEQQFSPDDMQLLYQTGLGVSLHRRNSSNLNRMMLILTTESLMTKLIKTTFERTATSLEEFAEQSFVSYSTAKRGVRKLQAHLAIYGCHYLAATNELEGPETMVRLFYYRVYWETYSHFTWPFKAIERQTILKEVHQRWQQLTDVAALQLSYWLVITHNRRPKHPLQLPQEVMIADGQQPEDVFLNYCRRFFCVDHRSQTPLVVSDTVRYATKRVMGDLVTTYQQQLRDVDQKRLTQQLDLLHSYSLIFPTGGLLLERDSVLTQLTEQRPQVVQQLRVRYHQWQASANAAFQNEDYLMANYATLLMTYFDLSVLNSDLKIRLLLDSSSFYRDWFVKELTALLQQRYRVCYVEALDECDVIVTNLDIPDHQQPVLSINIPLSQQDWQNLRGLLEC